MNFNKKMNKIKMIIIIKLILKKNYKKKNQNFQSKTTKIRLMQFLNAKLKRRIILNRKFKYKIIRIHHLLCKK